VGERLPVHPRRLQRDFDFRSAQPDPRSFCKKLVVAPLAITSPSGSVTEALGTRDDVVNVVVCESNEPAQGCRTDRVLCFRKVEGTAGNERRRRGASWRRCRESTVQCP